MIRFLLNNDLVETDLPPGLTLLDFIRYHRHLAGTKCGCREGDCGACTVLIGEPAGETVRYRSVTSCLMPLANAQGRHVVTIEGVNPAQGLTPVQEALVAENGTQCGFCTVGFVMSLTGFCLENATPAPRTIEQALSAIDGNICRCTGYKSIERAAVRLLDMLDRPSAGKNVVPDWFSGVSAKLAALQTPEFATPPGPKPTFVGGGTDLYVQRPEQMLHAPATPIGQNDSLRCLRETGGDIEIGGAVTVTDLLESELLHGIFPGLRRQLALVSSTPIRNMATVAGNLVNASPIGDLTVWLLALDARVVLRNGSAREVPLRNFYLGYKQIDKTADEVVEAIRFRRPAGRFYFNFEKVSKRTCLDIASVNSAIFLQMNDRGEIETARLAFGGVAPVPLLLHDTPAFFPGKTAALLAAEENLSAANALLQKEIAPISDVRGSAAYKRLLARQLLRAHFDVLFENSLS